MLLVYIVSKVLTNWFSIVIINYLGLTKACLFSSELAIATQTSICISSSQQIISGDLLYFGDVSSTVTTVLVIYCTSHISKLYFGNWALIHDSRRQSRADIVQIVALLACIKDFLKFPSPHTSIYMYVASAKTTLTQKLNSEDFTIIIH